MAVEYLHQGQWINMANATEHHVETNRYLVTVTGLMPWDRLVKFDGAPLRVAGKETFNVWGTERTGDKLVLDVLVR